LFAGIRSRLLSAVVERWRAGRRRLKEVAAIQAFRWMRRELYLLSEVACVSKE
jgi:hypothetical protein